MNRRQCIETSSAAIALMLSKQGLAQPADPTELGIAEAGPLLRSGDLSPVELVEAYLQRIDRFDGQLNSFITLTQDSALSRARALEAELMRGAWRGPLHGIPIALKDNIDTAGVLTSAGSELFASRTPEDDATVVTRLEQAGAIVLGKTNMHEFAYGASSAVTYYGPVRNPWNLDRIPGGSSGGSAAAVTARLCAGALGTDTGGSIRMPAAYCGIVGLKPTYGLASIRGIIPLSVSLDHVGPMCRTVADAAILLQALVGYDPRDVASIRASVPDYSSSLRLTTSGMRLGVPRSLFYEDVDAEILDGIERALDVLGELTASTRDVELPPLPQSRPVSVESYAYHAEYLETSSNLYDPATREQIMRGAGIPATEYAESLYQLELSRKAIDAVFEDVDLLITPTMARQPVDIDTALASAVEINPTLIRNAAPFNTYGIPTISIPCGFDSDGLPIGLQIAGRHLRELDVLALAHAYEQATDWHEAVPSLG
jgi:aspartyl-tRNA(Asn)/glutamyl-tRNA(Gln) amidotransferase subunit A